MSYRRFFLAALPTLSVFTQAHAVEGYKAKYILGPQDRLAIRVYDLRKKAGEAYPWTALNGEFSVGADGFVSMPILGEVRAADGTTADLASIIGATLKQKADLAEMPAASVEVIKFRSFYIIGSVQQPGKYEFQPGMTILQALSTAQGILRSKDELNTAREVLTSKGEIDFLIAERISLEAKISRLSSEISGASIIQPTPYLNNMSSDSRVTKSLRDEALLFSTRREALQSELAAIEQSKEIYKQELITLQSKSASLDRQLEFSRKELSQVNDLMSKGLSIVSRQLAAEQTQASFESNKLDNQLAKIRTQQTISRADRDVIEIKARYRKEALDDASIVRSKIDVNEAKISTGLKLLDNSEENSSALNDGNDIISFTLTHVTDRGSQTRRADESDAIEPGDVLRVIRTRARSQSIANSSITTYEKPLNNATSSSRTPDAKK